MAQRRVVVGSPDGLHARPAAEVARLAAAQPGGVRLTVGGGAAIDAGSVLALMNLGVAHGDEVVLEALGPDADAALARISAVLAAGAS